MARASTRTLLPLDRFAKVVGISPLHFNQVIVSQLDPQQDQQLAGISACDDGILQYGWQAHDRIGREECAIAIADAEALVTQWLGYSPAPTWQVNESVQAVRPANPAAFNLAGRDVRGFWNNVHLDKGYVISGGVEAWSIIQANAAVVYSDIDGDGYKETATVTVPTSVTDGSEIALAYPGTVQNGDYTWEIRPITPTISSGNVVIVCRREQLVKASLMEGLTAYDVEGENDANFLSIVDVWRHYNDPSQQVMMAWDLTGQCGCLQTTCAVCAGTEQTGCMQVRDTRLGLVGVSPGTWNAANNGYDFAYFTEWRQPERLKASYRAGWQNNSIARPLVNMDPKWERAISYLALSMLERPICSCENLKGYMEHWAEDIAATSITQSGGSQSFKVSPRLLDNPLGTTRASIFAWRLIVQDRIGEAAVNA